MRIILILFGVMLFCGCPGDEPAESGNSSATVADESFNPSEPIPTDLELVNYDGLALGMDSLEMSQIYNAPNGHGDGFNRVIQDFGDVSHHIVNFDRADGEPIRRIVASFYRDELYIVVDRREGINADQIDEWFDGLVEQHGGGYTAILPTSQWSWGDTDSVLLTFTKDNASGNFMNANIVLVHQPTRDAAHNYLELWEEEHPDSTKGS